MTATQEQPRYILVSAGLAPEAMAIKWLLEVRAITYDDTSGSPGFHWHIAKRYNASAEAPILISSGGAYVGLGAILQHLDSQMRPGEKILGETEEQRAKTQGLLALLQDRLLWPVQRLFDHYLPDHTPKTRADMSPMWLAPMGPTAVRWRDDALAAKLDRESFDEETIVASIEAVFDDVANFRGEAEFLGGDTPGTADIVFAALSAPVLQPEGTVPPAFAKVAERFGTRPAGQMALSVLTSHRPIPQRPMGRVSVGPSLTLRLTRLPAALWLARTLVSRFPVISFRGNTLALSWEKAVEVLNRDPDFIIEPVNKTRIEAVSGPFILGMDRAAPDLFNQREAIYGAQRDLDLSPVWQRVDADADALLSTAQATQGRIDIVNGYARRIAARTAAQVFGVSGPTEADLMRVLRAVFHETFLNLGDDPKIREAGIAAGAELGTWIGAEVAARGDTPGHDVLGGLITAQQRLGMQPESTKWMLAGLMVGAVDTTATAVSNVMEVLLSSPTRRDAVRRDLDDPKRMRQWCLEALRLRPHNPIILRKAAHDTSLGTAKVRTGGSVLAVTISAMQDAAVFPRPGYLRPGREMKRYLHFGYGLHHCAGRDINAQQIPALVTHLLRHTANRVEQVRFRGPFPDEVIVKLGGQ